MNSTLSSKSFSLRPRSTGRRLSATIVCSKRRLSTRPPTTQPKSTSTGCREGVQPLTTLNIRSNAMTDDFRAAAGKLSDRLSEAAEAHHHAEARLPKHDWNDW